MSSAVLCIANEQLMVCTRRRRCTAAFVRGVCVGRKRFRSSVLAQQWTVMGLLCSSQLRVDPT
jgi:hypothetical protein